jgi:hypothetical protein
MTSTPLAIPETDRIAALLAEVTGRTAPRPNAPPPLSETRSLQDSSAPPIDVTQTISVRTSVRRMLEEANGQNAAPEPVASVAGPERPAVAEPEPLQATLGDLSVSALFGLVNWRNQPDGVQPLPVIKPPPASGSEFTVAAMMTMFGWE